MWVHRFRERQMDVIQQLRMDPPLHHKQMQMS